MTTTPPTNLRSSFDPNEQRKCVVGVCCMDYKGHSKPMKEILNRLACFPEMEIVMFGEEVILNKEVEEWPTCDCLIAFHSLGFPLEKALHYIQLHPTVYSLNDLSWQPNLLDRRLIYRIMERNSIPSVKHVIVSRDGIEEKPSFIETKDYIEVNGKRMTKPFVEKPVDADDHNIYIYFHSNQGGGSVRLFRKISDKSSEKSTEGCVRKEGSYIYEEFIDTHNLQDIKVYTIGENYAHSESRKAPFVDGVVVRDTDGKEIRTLIQLSSEEMAIARKVCRAFKQNICGFDLLRGKDGKSYVCDVNGWSFVKNFSKYYDDFANIVRSMLVEATISRGLPQIKQEKGRVLRGVAAVFRHADRTPKQKVKVQLNSERLMELFKGATKEIKLKNDSEEDIKIMQHLVEISQDILAKKSTGLVEATDAPKLILFSTVIQRGFGGTKVQLKVIKSTVDENGVKRPSIVLLICKWGGILTHAGIEQSRKLGRYFAERVFPKENSKEFLQSLEVFSNTERRVRRTADAFTAGLLNVKEEELPQVFREDKLAVQLLGEISAGKGLMVGPKNEIHKVMHLEDPSEYSHLPGVLEIGNPLRTMKEIHGLIKELYNELPSQATLCEGETVPMMQQRWHRLTQNFYLHKKGTYDTTKIPDIFDYVNYDIIHNHDALSHIDLSRLYEQTELLAKFIVPGEYGLESKEKLAIGSLICEDLIHKFYDDMTEMSKGEGAKTRLYFTSESHLHSMRNVLLSSNSSKFYELIEPVELSYLSNLVFRIYENVGSSSDKFQIEVLFCSGTHNNPFDVMNNEHRQSVRPMVSVNSDLTLDEFKAIIEKMNHIIAENKEEK